MPSAWRHFRTWLIETHGITLPPGRILVDKMLRGGGDHALDHEPPAEVHLAQRDLDEMLALRAVAGRLLIADIVSLVWDGMTLREDGWVTICRAVGSPMVFPPGAREILRGRWQRVGRPEGGPMFPRELGSKLPIPVGLLSRVVTAALKERDVAPDVVEEEGGAP